MPNRKLLVRDTGYKGCEKPTLWFDDGEGAITKLATFVNIEAAKVLFAFCEEATQRGIVVDREGEA